MSNMYSFIHTQQKYNLYSIFYKQMDYTNKILTSRELKILRWVDWNSFQKRLSYNLKTNKFTKIRKWIYVNSASIYKLSIFDLYKIANYIYSPSYISLETVLNLEWVNFQYYWDVKLMSPYTKQLKIDTIPETELRIDFVKLPKELITNNIWLIQEDWYVIATKERAICDTLWRWEGYYFDNLSSVNWDLLLDIAKEYKNYNTKVYGAVLDLKTQQDAKKQT